jgi:DNA-binding response OmpR family regulator
MKKNLVIVDGNTVGPLLYRHLCDRYNPILCESGQALKRLLSRVTADIFLIETTLPGMSAHEICRLIRQNQAHARAPIVFFGKAVTLQEKLEGYEAGVDAFINKPFDAETLLTKLYLIVDKGVSHKRFIRTQGRIAEHHQQEIGEQWGWDILSSRLKTIHECEKIDQLGHQVVKSCEDLDLSNSAMIYLPTGAKYFTNSRTAYNENEYNTMLDAKRGARIISSGKQLIFNATNFNLLIRDHKKSPIHLDQFFPLLTIMIETANSKLLSLVQSGNTSKEAVAVAGSQ